jgi:uncharacterized protein YjbI with pentapeptide repeats
MGASPVPTKVSGITTTPLAYVQKKSYNAHQQQHKEHNPMANQEQLELLKHSVQEWNQWRREHPEIYPDLSHADLSNAYLCDAVFSYTDLRGSDLSHSPLHNANLSNANLSNANLSGSDLSNADLDFAKLRGTNLRSANLSSVYLYWTYLCNVNLSESDFYRAYFWETVFTRVDLSRVKGLETAIHGGPSTVNINSVTFPHDEHTRQHFLLGVGFSETQIENLLSRLSPQPTQAPSLFISYAHQDEAMVRRLRGDLRKNHVPCWSIPHDPRSSTLLVRGIEEAIDTQDKLLLILSHHTVNSLWVQQEVEAALDKEATTGQEILFPLRLDSTFLKSESLWAKRLRQRHIGDFTGWQDETTYQQAFTTLLRHLT